MVEFKYRPDVDGLRAVAVMLVILFHTGLGFSGGFIGVDVFFVISGFLITGLILKEQDSDCFSLRNFWLRRIRRIMPAATAMVIATLMGGYFLLPPNAYAELGKSTIAHQLMVSNVYFWRNTGYFDGHADLKPLLHTWSLAVEEQFYLVYPFLLMLLYRFGRRATLAALGAFAVVSLLVSQYGVQYHSSASFFLLPTRAWELLLGGIICFLPAPSRMKPQLLAFSSIISLAAILAAGWFYSPSTPFPGFSALLPCIATAVLIYSNSIRPSFPARVLALSPLVFVGLLSYSLYLWHWPILAFLRCSHGVSLSAPSALLALCVSFAAAFLSWKYIETPCRRAKWTSNTRTTLVPAIAFSIACIASGTWIYTSTGFANARFGSGYLPLIASIDEKEFQHILSVDDVVNDRVPRFGADSDPTLAVWGDSHAMALMPAVNHVCKEAGISGVQVTTGGTLPLLGFPNERPKAATTEFADKAIDYCRRNNIKTVILAGYWRRDATHPLFESCVINTAESLRALGIKVFLVRDVPDQKCDPSREFHDALKSGIDLRSLGVSLEVHRADQAAADAALEKAIPAGAILLDPTPYLVDKTGRCPLVIDGKSLYRDNDHITVAGAKKLIPMFRHALQVSSRFAWNRNAKPVTGDTALSKYAAPTAVAVGAGAGNVVIQRSEASAFSAKEHRQRISRRDYTQFP